MFYLFNTLLIFSSTSVNFYAFGEIPSKPEKSAQEVLLCRKCGADVADSDYLFSKSTPGAWKTEKQNLFGKHNISVLTLVNPFGIKFEVVTAEKAKCDNIGPQQHADSWFPGYTWRICVCPHCGQHLGWTFESSTDVETSTDNSINNNHSFHGLILKNILGENFTDSLIMMPKVYTL